MKDKKIKKKIFLIGLLTVIILASFVYAEKLETENDFDFSNPDAYEIDDFYMSLSDEDYSELDYNLVDFNNPLLDQTKINGKKYVQDKGCHQCILDIEKGNNQITYTEYGIKHKNGDSVSIPGTYPQGTRFIALSDRIEIIIPK